MREYIEYCPRCKWIDRFNVICPQCGHNKQKAKGE